MFQEIDYIISFSEKPADVSRDRLFISFPKNLLISQERDYLFHSPKNQQMFREIHYLFHSRKTS